MAGQRRRRSKWIVLLAAPLFFGLQAGLGVQLERTKPEQLDGAFGARLQLLRRQLAHQADKPLLVMLGSSRTMTGFRPDLLHDQKYLAFNFGREGSGPVKNLIYLRRLLDEGIRPDLLVVDVTVPALAQHRDVPWESRWVDGALLHHAERRTVEHYHDLRGRVLGQWLAARLLPSWQYNRTVAASLSLQGVTGYDYFADAPGMDPFGYRPVFLEVSAHQRGQLTRLALSQYGFLADQNELAPGAQRAVIDLVELCRREQIPLALVVMPEGTQFRGMYREPFKAACARFYAEVAERAPVIDAHAWIADEHFFDQHHLLPAGAEQFTRRLLAELSVLPVRAAPVRKRGGQNAS